MATEDTPLNKRQRAFVQRRIASPPEVSNTQVAIAAGYAPNSAAESASENLRRSNVQAALRQQTTTAAEKLGLTPEYVLGGLMDNHQRAMQAVPVLDAKGNPTGEYTYQGQVANRALELLGKHLRILGDEAPKSGDTYNQVVLQGYTVEQLRSLLQGMQGGGMLPSPPSNSDDSQPSGA